MSTLQHAQPTRWSRAGQVHASLAKLFAACWLVVTGVLLINPEVHLQSIEQYLIVAAPPAIPFVQLAWGGFRLAAITGAPLLAIGVVWFVASRHPASSAWRFSARSLIVAYWLFLWFGISLSA